MASTIHHDTEIEPVLFKRRFVIAYGAHPTQPTLSGCGYWSHALGHWVQDAEDATLFDTQAGALVYRRGNLLRMKMAMDDQQS